jgi:hypothetical protein
MSVVFIGNVGSRDVQVEGQANLPRDSRTLGEMILKDWDGHRSNLSFPIVMKALDTVINRHQQIDHIFLFASNQADDKYRHTDTAPFAEIVKRYLLEMKKVSDEAIIKIIHIDQNPSDYDKMLRLYGDKLQDIKNQLDGAHDKNEIYAAVTGGTPAMSFMLLWQGVEIFEQSIHPLYVIQDKPMPISLDIGRSLLLNALTSDLQASIDIYQYSAAYALLESKERFLRDAWRERYNTIHALLDFARKRYNFNFKQAEGALLGSDRGLDKAFKDTLERITQDICNRDEAWLLREEIYALQIDIKNEAYKDGVTHVFAFLESFLRLYAMRVMGIQLSEDYKKIEPDWLASRPELTAYLDGKKVHYENVNTFVLERILGFFAKNDSDIDEVSQQVTALEPVKKLRNSATHMHGGISKRSVEDIYPGGFDAIVDSMQSLYQTLFNGDFPPNPYDEVNHVIMRLIDEA